MRLDGCHGDRQGSGRGGREETGSSGLAHWLFHDAAGIGSPMDLCFPAEYEKTKENESEVPANRIHPQTACEHMEVPRQCPPIQTYPYPLIRICTGSNRQSGFGEGHRNPFAPKDSRRRWALRLVVEHLWLGRSLPNDIRHSIGGAAVAVVGKFPFYSRKLRVTLSHQLLSKIYRVPQSD